MVLRVTLENLLANPRSVGQALNAVVFGLSTYGGTASLVPSLAPRVVINKDGVPSDPESALTGWALDTSSWASGQLALYVLDTPVAPEHLIIGEPGAGSVYSNANRSIAGNDLHNPFLSIEATFSVSLPEVSNPSVEFVQFCFGTEAGICVGGQDPQPPIPEPATMALIGGGLLLLLPALRKRNQLRT